MKRLFFLIWVFSLLISPWSLAQDAPKAEVSNGFITAELYLPDAENGYYRATRFDWSGIIPYLEFDGHSYFGKWFDTYDPLVHESVMGPVEEFGQLGYEEAGIGESFLKIGVGMLVKPEESRYNKFKTYKISDHGSWKVKSKTNEVLFHHRLNSSNYSYSYEKRICLPEGEPKLVLSHKFTNTGEKSIDTQVYNHNFFMIDLSNIGPDYVIKLPFEIQAEGRLKGIGRYAEIDKNNIRFIKRLPEGDQVYIQEINGFDTNAGTYSINIENRSTRAGVKIHSNRPLTKLSFWSISTTICPEPFIRVKADPGETFEWETTYTFYTF